MSEEKAPYSFQSALGQWSKLPVDDLGYFAASWLARLHDAQLADAVTLASSYRFMPQGWRNEGNKLVEFMGLGSVKGKTVMDFGCGLGVDSLMFARNGASIILADINVWGLMVAQRVLGLAGQRAEDVAIVIDREPYFPDIRLDLFWSSGVLHHLPYAGEVLRRACSQLNPGGECRVVLYSDKRWERMMGCEPPVDTPAHPRFQEFVRKCDSVGHYADWYSKDKLEKLVADFAVVKECSYIARGELLAAVVIPNGDYDEQDCEAGVAYCGENRVVRKQGRGSA